MVTTNRGRFLSSLLAGAVIAMVGQCTVRRSQGKACPDKQTVLSAVKAAIAGKTKEEILTQLDERAGYYLKLSNNCAQSSFLALRDLFNLPDGGISRAS